MAGVEVLGCMSAIVSAFQGGADLVQSIQERKSKKKRRKESDMEQMYAEKILGKAMLDAAEKTQTECVERRHRFGQAFMQGDSVATSELKDVMISLQMEVIQPLQLARSSESSTLDATTLHEIVITYKAAIVRCLDNLCYRITVSHAGPSQYSGNEFVSPISSPGLPQRMSLNFGAMSLQDASRSRPERSIYHRPSASIASTTASDGQGSSSTKTSPDNTLSSDSDNAGDRMASVWSRTAAGSQLSVSGSVRSTGSGSTCEGSLPAQPEVRETEDDVFRANSAPEVVTKEYESMLSQQALRSASLRGPPMTSLNNVHPAYRDHYMEAPMTIFEEPDYPWSPLTRPAKHNNYHNFCKGAWKSRQKLSEGLSISMRDDKGVTIPYWKCKHCEFRSKATSSSSSLLPDSIYFSGQHGIRYRWVFLVKSHAPAPKHEDHHDAYGYACIFCAAQGTAEGIKYKDLKSLLGHVVSKHKTHMMTPEVREKTKCVVGGTPGKELEWDVNLPETQARNMSRTVGKFVISAVTGLS